MFSWFILLFALLQGLLEWLPVSSQGQTVTLIIALFPDISSFALSLAIWLHLGTMIAVIIKFRHEIFQYINIKNKNPEIVQWRRFLIFSTLGTIVTGVPCYFLVSYLIETDSTYGEWVMLVIGIALIITAIFLFYSERKNRQIVVKGGVEESEEKNTEISIGRKIEDLSLLKMATSGLFQGFSIIPGISRSGITMSGLLLMSVKKEDAIKGSFLMSIPAVLGGFLIDIVDTAVSGGDYIPPEVEWWVLLIAIVVTAVIGYLTMELFLYVAKKFNFSVICLILGILTIVLFAVRFAGSGSV